MKVLISLALAAALAGCASSGTQVSEKTALQFKENVTTEAEIVSTLGQPTGVSVMNGKRFLSYTGSQVRVKAATFIPVVGMFAGGADHQMTMAMYQIGSNGVLEKITYTSTGGGSRSGSNPAEMPAREPLSK